MAKVRRNRRKSKRHGTGEKVGAGKKEKTTLGVQNWCLKGAQRGEKGKADINALPKESLAMGDPLKEGGM